jgi:hypothetical protein
LTLFRPTTGEVRAQAVTQTTNAVLHPWLQAELAAILSTLPAEVPTTAPGRQWPDWGWSEAGTQLWAAPAAVPPIRLILVWDNLRGHTTAALVGWLVRQGILPLYTPLRGSWLNMAESLQRILVRRALAGQQPGSEPELQQWLEATVVGWSREPTPFVWGGKRAARRQRARERRHPLGGSGAYTHWPIRRLRHEERKYYNRYVQVN